MKIKIIAAGLSKWERFIRRWGVSFLIGEDVLFDALGRKIYEQFVVVKTGEGLAAICGCAHPGAVNIVRHVKEGFQEDVCPLTGGFHLKDNTGGTNFNIIKNLKGLGIRRIAPMHCTGRNAAEIMCQAFEHGFIRVREGDNIQL